MEEGGTCYFPDILFSHYILLTLSLRFHSDNSGFASTVSVSLLAASCVGTQAVVKCFVLQPRVFGSGDPRVSARKKRCQSTPAATGRGQIPGPLSAFARCSTKSEHLGRILPASHAKSSEGIFIGKMQIHVVS